MCLLALLCFCNTASASTSSALAASTYAQSLDSYFGGEYEPPYKLSDDGTSVDDETGAVVTRATDLDLPGKNGLDFKAIRTHNTQNTYERPAYTSEITLTYVYFDVYTYTSEEEGDSILVSIPYESDVEENQSFVTTTTRLGRKRSLSRGNTKTVYYDGIPSAPSTTDKKYYSDTIRTYNIDKSVHPITLSRTAEDKIEPVNNTRRGNYISKDLMWGMEYKPRLKMEIRDTDGECIYGFFRTEEGAVYPVELGCQKITASEATDAKPVGTYVNYFVCDSNEFTFSIDSDVAFGNYHYVDSEHNVEHEKGFFYTFKITSRDGKQYFFKSDSSRMTGSADYEVQAVLDRYGNMIDYVNMTDSMGRKIEVEHNGIKVTAGDLVQEIRYEMSGPQTSDADPDDYYTFDDLYTLTVYKTQYSGQNVLASKDITKYILRKNQVVLDRFNSYSNDIVSVIYPTGGYTYFEYTNMENAYKISEPLFANCSVIAKKYDYDAGQKNVTTYAYERGKRQMEKLVKTNSDTGVVSEYDFDGYGRTKKIVSKGDGKAEVRYKYSAGGYNKQLAAAEVIDGMSQTAEYSYNKYGEVIGTNDGFIKNTAVYDDTYNIQLTALSRPTDSEKGVLTVNTLTDDGKSIAQSDVYEVTFETAESSVETARVLKSVTCYVYDSYGNVVSVKTNDGEKDITTQYSYKYYSGGAYDVIRVTADVEDADGNTENVITKTKYDSLGRIVSETDANSNTTTTEYTGNSAGAIIKTTTADGSISTVSYDLKNNTIVAENPNGTKTKYVYTKLGGISRVYVTNDDENYILAAERTYDDAMRPELDVVYRDYDKTKVKDYVKTAYTYVNMPDSRVSCTKMTDRKGSIIRQINYDYGKHRLLAAAHNADTSKKYYNTVTQTVTGDDTIEPYKIKSYTDVRGLTYKEEIINPSTGAADYFNTYLYDNSGNLLETKDMRAWNEGWTECCTSKIEYDVFNRPVAEYDALGNRTTKTYDSLGRMVSETDAKGNTAAYEYDSLGRNIMNCSVYKLRNSKHKTVL